MTNTQRTTRWFLVRLIVCVLLLAGVYIEVGPVTAVAIGLLFVRTEVLSVAINSRYPYSSGNPIINVKFDGDASELAEDVATVIAQRLG